jgi:asparagine synthase (glutamine-hydrolysing)
MPPIFGIAHTKSLAADPEMFTRMKNAANYTLPRTVETLETDSGLFAAAIREGNPLHRRDRIMAQEGPWIVLADAAFYSRDVVSSDQKTSRPGDQQTSLEVQTILQAWLQQREQCVKYMYGDFTFIVFNMETGEIFCGRDPLGVRPFFYTIHDGSFIFASELKYVLSSFQTKPPLRQDYLLDSLVNAITPKEQSSFEGIYRLKPGCFLHITGGELSCKAYWTIDPKKRIRFDNEDEYISLFREKLVKAVTSRCEGVDRLGSELSGGLDSSAVCGIAAKYAQQNNTPFTAYSNVFPDGTDMEFKDEQEFMDALVKHLPMNHVKIDRLNNTISQLLHNAVHLHNCFIQQNYSIFSRGIYEAAGQQGTEVLLSGFGGDELVSARTSIPWNELIREGEWKVIADELYYNGATPKSILKTVKIGINYFKSRIYTPAFTSGVFTKKLLDRRFAKLPLQPDYALKNNLRQRLTDKFRKPWHDSLAERQAGRIMLDHLPQRMEYCYVAAAQYGMEYRYPLLDADLVETCLAFPPWLKQHHGINRYIFRQAIRDFVPEVIHQRNDKTGATIPHTLYSFSKQRDEIIQLVQGFSDLATLNKVIDCTRFPEWYDKLVRRNKNDINYLMPGAFYGYLMIGIYFKNEGNEGR